MRRILSRYRAAIFDIDGTLADAMGVWEDLCRNWLSARGIRAEASLEQDIAAMTLTQSAEYLIGVYGLNLGPEAVIKEWESLVIGPYAHSVPLKEGAAELLSALAQEGVKIAAATSCFPGACEALLKKHRIRDYFSAIVYSDEVARDKTFPDLYLACAGRLGVKAGDCVVFEDYYTALEGIRAAGMGVAAVYDPAGAEQWEDFKKEADFSFVSLRELLQPQNIPHRGCFLSQPPETDRGDPHGPVHFHSG